MIKLSHKYNSIPWQVTAIGSPGGLDNSCTIGIVSGLKRCPKAVGIPDKAGVLQYIQTDAAINVGNSGGPLVDVESGDIVGINTCIRANMEGTSFAIPINKVMGMLGDLYEGRQITHGYLGVQMSTMNPTLARYHNMMQSSGGVDLPERNGVMIEKVCLLSIDPLQVLSSSLNEPYTYSSLLCRYSKNLQPKLED